MMRVKKVRLHGLFLSLLVLVGLYSPSAFCAEWKLTPDLSVRGEFNDNLTLTSFSHNSVWGTWITPGLNIQYSTEILEILLDSSLAHVNYFGDKDDEESFTNFYFPLSVKYAGERNRWNFLTSVIRDNTLQSELEQTGLVLDFLQRMVILGQVDWAHAVTELLTFKSSYAFTDVTYDDGVRVGIFDRQTHSISFGGDYELVEDRLQLQTTGSYVNNHVPDFPFLSQSLSLDIGIVYQISETLQTTLSGGPSYINTSNRDSGALRRNEDIAWIGTGSVTKTWERTTITGVVSRSLNPSGNGQLLETSRVFLSLSQELSETLGGTVRGSYFVNDSAGSGGVSNSKYWDVGSSLNWKWSESWTVGWSFLHRQQDRGGGETAKGNSISMQLAYQWSPFSVSR